MRPLLMVGLLLLPRGSGLPQRPSQPTFPAETEAVMVDVVVTGRGGEPVVGLGRESFSITEDGVPQEIEAFEAVHRPVAVPDERPAPPPEPRSSSNRQRPGRENASFLIVFDELHLDPAEAVHGREAVAEFLERGVAPGDRVGLVGTAKGVRWIARMPEGRETLLRALASLRPRRVGEDAFKEMTEYEAMRIDREHDPIVMSRFVQRPVGRPPPGHEENENDEAVLALAARVYARAELLADRTLGIVEHSLASMAAGRGRKSLVLVSGGIFQDPHLAAPRLVETAAHRANAAIHFVDARGLVAAPQELQADVGEPTSLVDLSFGVGFTGIRERGEGSEALAVNTGGLIVKNRNDLGVGLTRIGSESRSYYLVGYTPTNRIVDGRFRKIKVEVAREGVSVRARPGYYAQGPKGRQVRPETRDAAIQRALDAPFDLPGVSLRALAQVFEEVAPGQVAVRLTAEADLRSLAFSEREGIACDTLETLVLVTRSDTGESTRFDRQFEMRLRPETRARYERTWFPITRKMELAPGPYQAKIVARDGNSGSVGSLTHDFEVPELSGLRVSSLLLGDRLRENARPTARAPEPTARRHFAPSGVLHCQFEIYGALKDPGAGQPNVTAGFSIRRADGRILTAAAETPLRPGPDGVLARAFGVSLDGAPPGSYEVIVVVTDLLARCSAEAREPFVLEESTAVPLQETRSDRAATRDG